MKAKIFLCVALAVLPCAAAPKKKAPHYPSFVRFQIAGEDVRKDGDTKFDPKAGFYLIHTGDCDGASVDLILTPSKSPKDNWDWTWTSKHNEARVTRLPRLRSGSGVNIGDSPATVQRKLGAGPHNIYAQSPIREWTYSAVLDIPERE